MFHTNSCRYNKIVTNSSSREHIQASKLFTNVKKNNYANL
jgi:hypothetical protein